MVSHRHRADLLEEYPLLLQQRAVEGLIAVDTAVAEGLQIERERFRAWHQHFDPAQVEARRAGIVDRGRSQG